MKSLICFGICLPLFLLTLFSANMAFGFTPLHVRNQFPPHLMFLKPNPDSPHLIPKKDFRFSFSADYCSVYVNEVSEDWIALIDMEMTVLNFSLGYGFTDYLDISLDIPFASTSGGFLDDFLGNFHDALDIPNYGRENRPKNDFAYYLRKNGKDWFESQFGGLHLTDSTLSVKFSFVNKTSVSAGLKYTLKLPVGNESHGFGSGGFDHGFSLLSRFQSGAFAFYLNPSLIFLSDPETLGANVSANTVLGIFTGGEYLLNPSWSLLAQLNHYNPPFEDTGIPQLDDNSIELTLGCIWRLTPKLNLEFAFSEDLMGSVPDFNLHAAIAWDL